MPENIVDDPVYNSAYAGLPPERLTPEQLAEEEAWLLQQLGRK